MLGSTYRLIEQYMLMCMNDSAHDRDHVYRVLYTALDIADTENGVDADVLISACLLHDIGRREQFENPELDHAETGAEKAFRFLTGNGFQEDFAAKVRECIHSHRYRSEAPPESIEAKILFDADKIDVSGAIGIARTLMYSGQTSRPLYLLLSDGTVSDGTNDRSPSFLREYKYKLENVYSRFYTKRGFEIAKQRQKTAAEFYNSIFHEADFSYRSGADKLGRYINGKK